MLAPRARQRGVTLMIALIVLVVMTLAGIALVRSVDSTNIIAGNLAFQQAATSSGDKGIETAISWLEANKVTSGYLDSNHNSLLDCRGYTASRVDKTNGTSWSTWWNGLNTCQTVALAADPSGNTVSYTIFRMCSVAGAASPSTAGQYCSAPTIFSNSTCHTAQCQAMQGSTPVYYRITTRATGPRGTKSYIEVIVAM